MGAIVPRSQFTPGNPRNSPRKRIFFPQIALAIGVFTSSRGMRVRRFCVIFLKLYMLKNSICLEKKVTPLVISPPEKNT